MYVELTKGTNTDRGHIVEYMSVTNEARGHECYISHYPFDKTIIDYVDIHKTIKGHKGKHFCPYILIDIDNDITKHTKIHQKVLLMSGVWRLF